MYNLWTHPPPSQLCCHRSGGWWNPKCCFCLEMSVRCLTWLDVQHFRPALVIDTFLSLTDLWVLSMWSESTLKKIIGNSSVYPSLWQKENGFLIEDALLVCAFLVSALWFSCTFWFNHYYVAVVSEGLVLRLVIKEAVDNLVVNLLIMSVLV